MIAVVDVKIQAENPSMPLWPMKAYVGSPSSIRVRNVPKKIGDWCISKIVFVANYPDNTTQTVECRLIGGVYVGTIDGSTRSGTVEQGYSIIADGVDENENAVNGYVLGKGDVEILVNDTHVNPDEVSYGMRLFEDESEQPKSGDVWLGEDSINIVDVDGNTKTFSPPDLSDYAKKSELATKQNKIFANGILSGDGQGNITAADMSVFRQKLDLSVYQQTYTRWTILRDNVDVTNQVQQPVYGDWGGVMGWQCFNCVLPGEDILDGGFQPDPPEDALYLQLITQGDSIYDYYLTRSVNGVAPTQDMIATNSTVSSAIQSKRDYTDLSMPPPYVGDYWTRDDNGWLFEKVGANFWIYDDGTGEIHFEIDKWVYYSNGE